MIISGGSGTNLVEVIAPFGNVSCSLPNLPTDKGRFSHTHDSSLVCGGTYQDDMYVDAVDKPALYVYQACINLTSSGWVKTSHMLKYPRNRHSSWAVGDGVILIGGCDKRPKEHWARNTTELVKFDGTTVEAFPLKQWTL